MSKDIGQITGSVAVLGRLPIKTLYRICEAFSAFEAKLAEVTRGKPRNSARPLEDIAGVEGVVALAEASQELRAALDAGAASVKREHRRGQRAKLPQEIETITSGRRNTSA